MQYLALTPARGAVQSTLEPTLGRHFTTLAHISFYNILYETVRASKDVKICSI